VIMRHPRFFFFIFKVARPVDRDPSNEHPAALKVDKK
jgi:hypothetical protein